MNDKTKKYLENLHSEDRQLQNEAFSFIIKETEAPVEWANEVWDQLVEGLHHKDNHVRAISAQTLANLKKSDPKNRMKKDSPVLMAVTKDEKIKAKALGLIETEADAKYKNKYASVWK